MEENKIKKKNNKDIPTKRQSIGIMKQTQNIIRKKCRQDHLQNFLTKQNNPNLTVKKKNINLRHQKQQSNSNGNTINSINQDHIDVTIYQNTHVRLPSIFSDSTYQNHFKFSPQKQNIVLGKQQKSHFNRMSQVFPLQSQYQNNFQTPTKDPTNEFSKQNPCKPSNNISIDKNSHFKGQTVYHDQYVPHQIKHISSPNYIKNVDHLNQNHQMKYHNSEYQKQYAKRRTKDKLPKVSLIHQNSKDHYFFSRIPTLGQQNSTNSIQGTKK